MNEEEMDAFLEEMGELDPIDEDDWLDEYEDD